MIWRLDQLGRSVKHLLDLIEDLEHRDIALVPLSEQIETTSGNGRLFLWLLAGLEAAGRHGRVGGRPVRSRGQCG